MKKTSHKKPVSSTPLPVEHFEVTEDFGDNSTVVPQTDNAYEIYKSKMEKLEESDFIEESISEESQQNILSHRSDHNSATFGSQRSRGLSLLQILIFQVKNCIFNVSVYSIFKSEK